MAPKKPRLWQAASRERTPQYLEATPLPKGDGNALFHLKKEKEKRKSVTGEVRVHEYWTLMQLNTNPGSTMFSLSKDGQSSQRTARALVTNYSCCTTKSAKLVRLWVNTKSLTGHGAMSLCTFCVFLWHSFITKPSPHSSPFSKWAKMCACVSKVESVRVQLWYIHATGLGAVREILGCLDSPNLFWFGFWSECDCHVGDRKQPTTARTALVQKSLRSTMGVAFMTLNIHLISLTKTLLFLRTTQTGMHQDLHTHANMRLTFLSYHFVVGCL